MIRPPKTTALLLTLTACAGAPDSDAEPLGMVVDTLDGGIVRVSNTARAGWSPETSWRLEEDLRLGTVDGGGPEQFSQISGFLSDESDRVYILDYPSQEIRVFEADGTWSHTIGGEGQGPGELSGAAGMNWGPDGNLWVWETRNGRFSAFTPEGEFVTSHRRETRGVLYPWRGEFTPDGQMVDWGVEHVGLDSSPGAPAPTRTVFYPIRLGPDFLRLDTLPSLGYDRENTADGETALFFGRGLSVYQDRRGRVWAAMDTKEYVIDRRTLDGEVTLRFSLEVEPNPVTQNDRDSLEQMFLQYPPALRDEYESALDELPPTKPVVRRIFSDNAGHVYVLPDLPSAPMESAVDVFRDTGEYLGRMALPHPIIHPYPPPYATPTHIWVGVADELDVPYAVRLRIVKP